MRRSRAANLSETELLGRRDRRRRGDGGSRQSRWRIAPVKHFRSMLNRAKRATRSMPPANGRRPRDLFADAERRQRDRQPDYPLLYSLQGYRYCDLLLSQGRRRRRTRSGGADLRWARQHRWFLEHRARYFDPRPRSSSPGAAEPGGRSFARNNRAAMCASLLPGSTRPSKACAPRAETTMFLAASSPAPPSAAPSAIGTARRATSTKRRRSPSRGRCGFISAKLRSNARGSRWRASRPSRRSTASSSRARRRPLCRRRRGGRAQ